MHKLISCALLSVTTALVVAFVPACSGSSNAPTPTPQPTPTPTAATLTGVSLTSQSVSAGASVQGTVTLSGATSSAANVSLSSSPAGLNVPGSVTVPAGSSNAPFTVSAPAGNTSGQFTITAAYNGATQNTTLNVTPSGPNADFGVVADANTGTTPGQLQCAAVQISGQSKNSLKCIFDASNSTPNPGITNYSWSLSLDGNNGTLTFSSATPKWDHPEAPCNSFGNATRGLTLTITSSAGSATVTKQVTFLKPTAC